MFGSKKRAAQADLARIQQALRTVERLDPIFKDPFFELNSNLRALLGSIGPAFEPNFAAADELFYIPGSETVIDELWPGSSAFHLGGYFSNTKFFLVTRQQQSMKRNWSTGIVHAFDQLMAAYKTGKADPEYANHMLDVGLQNTQFRRQAMVILAHDDARWQAANTVRSLANSDILREANALREQYFMARWLPTLISTAEYQQAKTLPPLLLRDLYAPYWQGGYAAYRNAMRSKKHQAAA